MHGIRLDYRKTFLVINFLQLIHHSVTPGDTGSVPVHIGTRTPVARDEYHNRGTIPMPTFARRPSTISSLFPVDIPQNSMVGQQRQQISELQFDGFPAPSTFLRWKIRFKNQVTTCSYFPSGTMLWITEVEMVDSLERYCEFASKTTQQLQKVATPCLDDHQFEEEEEVICWRINCLQFAHRLF